MQGSRKLWSLRSCDIEVVCSQTALIVIYERASGLKQTNGNGMMSQLTYVCCRPGGSILSNYLVIEGLFTQGGGTAAVKKQIFRNSTTRQVFGEREM